MHALADRLGLVHAVPALLTYYLALLAGGLLAEEPDYYYIACVLLLALYCGARPHHRWDVFWYGFGPGVCWGILNALFGLSGLWGLLVLLGGLLALFEIERQPDADEIGPGDAYLVEPGHAKS